MFTLLEWKKNCLKRKGKPQKEYNANNMVKLIDILTLVMISAFIWFVPAEQVANINDGFEKIINTLIFGVILSAIISSGLFNKKNKKESEHNKNGIVIVVMGLPLLFIIIPVLLSESGYIELQTILYYLVFSCLVHVLKYNVIDVIFKKTMED